MVSTRSNQRSKNPSDHQEAVGIEMQNMQSEQSRSNQSTGQQKERKATKVRTQQTTLCVQGNSKRPRSVYIATVAESNEGSSDRHTDEYIPLGTSTPTPMPASPFPTQCSQPAVQPPNVYTQVHVEDGREAAPLDG